MVRVSGHPAEPFRRARFAYTPGTAATPSTTTSAGLPPHFTFAGTTIVDRGAVGFAVPNQPFGFAGTFDDKEWMEVDTNAASPCAGYVYVEYTAFHGVSGGFPIPFSRSTDGGASFSSPRIISSGGEAGTSRNQGSDIAVSATAQFTLHTGPSPSDRTAKSRSASSSQPTAGALHVAWFDFRNSVTPENEALDVFYACTNCDGVAYPDFSQEQRVTDVPHNGNCQMFGGGSVAFHGDYIELDARWDGMNHIVHVVWTDNRDVPAAECDLTPGPGDTNSVGNRNQNIYTDRLVISP